MLRRIALLVALLDPIAGLAQASNEVLISPSAFGLADCTSTTSIGLTWTSSVVPTLGTTPDFYRILVSNTSGCPTTSGTQVTGTLGEVTATDLAPSYPTAGTIVTPSDFFSKAGITAATCPTSNVTIYVCVQLWPNGGGSTGSPRSTATGQAKLEVSPPPVPVSVAVAPGDSALFVNWADGTKNPDGTSNTIAAVSYNVTAVGSTGTVTNNSTSKSYRLGGLTNGVTYSVTVTSVSAGGNESLASTAVTGTPKPVDDFWNNYTGVTGHREQGGCGGGPAGALSLLGVALALRGLRRRS
jgi:hypothetical protein